MAMTWPDAVVKFANAIKVAENSPPEWNNPLSLTGADKGSFRVLGTANAEGVWKFATYEDGWNAGCTKVYRFLSGRSLVYHLAMTIAEFGVTYSHSQDGNEGRNVAAELGVPETMSLGEWVAANPLGD
jgi:hypothetical protein